VRDVMEKEKVKKYSMCSELLWDVSNEKYYNSFTTLIEKFKICKPLACTCLYDKDIIDLSVSERGVEVKTITEKKPFIRRIILKELDVIVETDTILKELFRISRAYDATLFIKSNSEPNSKTLIIVNDNGHDYINFDKHELDRKTVKALLKRT
jgi:hypothetical protein